MSTFRENYTSYGELTRVIDAKNQKIEADYDDVGRLTITRYYAADDYINPVKRVSYTYNKVGNRLSAADFTDWAYSANNQLLSYNGTAFEYDLSGNLTSKTSGGITLNYIYDIENRLIRIEDTGGIVIAEYYYDPFGRRLWKEVGGVRTYFMYADEGLVGEYDATGVEMRTYGWRPDSLWMTDPLFLKEGGVYYFYHNDHLGTPMMLTNQSGAVVWSARYSSFGEAIVDVNSIENNLRLPGQYYDTESGLHYNWFRYYSPEAGRYITADPIGLLGGVNLYAYVLNNPVNWIDPFGLRQSNLDYKQIILQKVIPPVLAATTVALVIYGAPLWTIAAATGGSMLYSYYLYRTGQISGRQLTISLTLSAFTIGSVGSAITLTARNFKALSMLSKHSGIVIGTVNIFWETISSRPEPRPDGGDEPKPPPDDC